MISLFAAGLGFAQHRGWTTAVAIIAILLILPLLVLGPTVGVSALSSYSSNRRQELRGQFRDPVLNEMGVAIRNSDHLKLKALVAGHPRIDWSARDRAGFTLLGVAVEQGRLPTLDKPEHPLCLQVLVEAGVPYQDDALESNARMLHDLVTSVDEGPFETETLALLLRAGANPNENDNGGTPALIGMYMEANKARVLLNAGAELPSLRIKNDGEYRGWDALMIATMRARWDLALLYLERGCDPSYQAPDGKSALGIANEQEERINYVNESINRNAFLRALAAAKAKAASPF